MKSRILCFFTSIFNWLTVVLLISSSTMIVSCNNQTGTRSLPTGIVGDSIVVIKWLDIGIKFSHGVDPTVRQTALHSLESILIDTINQLRQQPTYANYNPELSTSSEPAKDSLYFHVVVASKRFLKDSTCDCLCTCPTCKPGQCPCSPSCPRFLKASAGGSSSGPLILSDVADTVKVNDVIIYNK